MLHSPLSPKSFPVFPGTMLRSGFTLIEILITMTIMSILLAIGLPPMSDFIVKTRLNGNVNQFIAAAILARTEAIKRGRPVVLCPSVNAEFDRNARCVVSSMPIDGRKGFDWGKGWIVAVESTNIWKPVLLRQAALGRTTIVHGGKPEIKYDGLGRPGSSFTSLRFRDGKFDRTVCVSISGRMRVIKGTEC